MDMKAVRRDRRKFEGVTPAAEFSVAESTAGRKLPCVVLLRHPLRLARGAALDEGTTSTIRSVVAILPFSTAFLSMLVITEDGPIAVRFLTALMCVGSVPVWLYFATMIRGYALRGSIEPAPVHDRFSYDGIDQFEGRFFAMKLLLKFVLGALAIAGAVHVLSALVTLSTA